MLGKERVVEKKMLAGRHIFYKGFVLSPKNRLIKSQLDTSFQPIQDPFSLAGEKPRRIAEHIVAGVFCIPTTPRFPQSLTITG